MKKIERYIYIVLIVILVGVIASGTTYMLMKDKEEKITLSEKELEEYLSYVPSRYTDGSSDDAYIAELKLNKLSDKTLIENVLGFGEIYDYNLITFGPQEVILDGKSDYYFYKIPASNVKQIIKKCYNRDIKELMDNISDAHNNYINGLLQFDYYQGYFYGVVNGGGDFPTIVNYINNYEVKNNELLIYEYRAKYYHEFVDEPMIEDYKTGNSYGLGKSADEDYARNYIKENKDKFTKYKHTFKKNNTGYYWYSTEVVK